VILHAIAKDYEGRVFTNCSSIQPEYKISGEGTEQQESTIKMTWD